MAVKKHKIKKIEFPKIDVKKFTRYMFGVIVGFGIISLILNFQVLRLDDVTKLSYKSFALIHFIGYLFFVIIPVDFLPFVYLYYGFDPYFIFSIAFATAFLAHILNYAVGYLVSTKLIDKFIRKEKYVQAEHTIDNYGGYAVFLFNLFPLPSSILLLAAGIVRYDFRKAIFWSMLGLAAKYAIMVAGYKLFF